MSLHISDLEYLRAGWQKVVDCGQYGDTIYVFQLPDGRIGAVTNKHHGVGELIETITAARPQAAKGAAQHGLGENIPREHALPRGDGTRL